MTQRQARRKVVFRHHPLYSRKMVPSHTITTFADCVRVWLYLKKKKNVLCFAKRTVVRGGILETGMYDLFDCSSCSHKPSTRVLVGVTGEASGNYRQKLRIQKNAICVWEWHGCTCAHVCCSPVESDVHISHRIARRWAQGNDFHHTRYKTFVSPWQGVSRRHALTSRA